VFWGQMADLGWLAMTVPEAFDGLQLGLTELAIVAEEFGYALTPGPFLPSALVTWLLSRHGSATLQSRLLPALASAEAIGTWALEYPGGNGEVTVADGRMTGVRRFVPEALDCTHAVVDATSGPGSPRVLAVVDLAAHGVARTPQHTLDLVRGYATLEFDGVALASDAVCAPPGGVEDLLRGAVVLQCAESVGVARRLLEMTLDHSITRHQFDRPIGSFQAIKHRIADMHIALQGAVAATEESTWAVEHRRSDADVAVHVAKSWTARAAAEIASEALQLHGGIGFTWEHDLHLFMRRAKVNELLVGSPAWHEERLFAAVAAGTA
jgi:alkylation response protein AidB-like acyl-CoA dehydrogenase